MSGLVDTFWLWHYMLLAGVIGVALAMTLLVVMCAKAKSRLVGATIAAIGGWLAATWFGSLVRRHTRARGA